MGTHPQRAVHCRGSFMISSPKRYIKLPQTLLLFSQPLFAAFPCSLPFLRVFPAAFFTLLSPCPLCYFTILRSSALSPSFFLHSSVDLLHFCPYLLLVFLEFISILHPLLLLQTPVSKCFFSFYFYYSIPLLPSVSISVSPSVK